jgi:hypothetical protein
MMAIPDNALLAFLGANLSVLLDELRNLDLQSILEDLPAPGAQDLSQDIFGLFFWTNTRNATNLPHGVFSPFKEI